MSVSESDVKKIATLARLEIASHDVPEYSENLNKILALVEQMNTIDTTGVAPMAHPLDAKQRLRDDQVTEDNQREALLALAPMSENGLFLVPKVIE